MTAPSIEEMEPRGCPTPGACSCIAALHAKDREIEELRGLYMELLYAVASKHPDESRHVTALRYIRERETPSIDAAKGAKG